ncbi:hypothetical protein ACJIZ3_002770 [Penstemon smallii]|uniref:CRAL-TRIO domain-containing protein n=1 Tax=Penstemon smallii TaxID=265156 RepID=A0ABD3U8H4_9LAMI
MNNSVLSPSEQEELIKKLEIFKIQGRDKRGNPVLQIIGKHFPGKVVNVEGVKKYLEDEIFPCLGEHRFSVVYVHTGVKRGDNFPGISTLKSIYEAIPLKVKENLEAIKLSFNNSRSWISYSPFLGRKLQKRGQEKWYILLNIEFSEFKTSILLFISNNDITMLYWKLRYVNRLEFLWDNVRRKGMEIPEFVYDFDEEMEYRPIMDYGLESDHPGLVHGAPSIDSSVSTYSMRCIA